jgi:spore coat protein H
MFAIKAARIVTVALLIRAALTAVIAASPGSAKREASDKLFSEQTVRVFDIEIPQQGLSALRGAPRTYVRGKITEGGTVLADVGIHLKGMSSFRPVDDKPSFAVKFNKYVPDQEYCGLSRLMFNNSVQDPTYLAEFLATGLFRDAGLPAARVTHARVRLNGRDLGLYVLIEGMNKPFLKRFFTDTSGNLYEGYLQDIDAPLEQDGGSDHDRADLRRLFDACNTSDPHQRFERVGRLLDVDRFVSFAAMEMLTGHWDGYIIHTNNYRLYHDPASDRMVFITHGLDWAFRRPQMSILPAPRSIVGRAVLQTPEGEVLYRERIGTLFTNVFQLAKITNRMDQTLAKLRAGAVPEIADIEKNAAIMRQGLISRAQSVAEQLAGKAPAALAFDRNNLAALDGWRAEFDRGKPILERATFEGRPTLHIKANGGRSRASWRTQVHLLPGRYRVEGTVYTRDLDGNVALRVSGSPQALRLTNGAGWRPISHAFEVSEPGSDIEFVCEFYGGQGEAWFDLPSLKVKRF